MGVPSATAARKRRILAGSGLLPGRIRGDHQRIAAGRTKAQILGFGAARQHRLIFEPRTADSAETASAVGGQTCGKARSGHPDRGASGRRWDRSAEATGKRRASAGAVIVMQHVDADHGGRGQAATRPAPAPVRHRRHRRSSSRRLAVDAPSPAMMRASSTGARQPVGRIVAAKVQHPKDRLRRSSARGMRSCQSPFAGRSTGSACPQRLQISSRRARPDDRGPLDPLPLDIHHVTGGAR